MAVGVDVDGGKIKRLRETRACLTRAEAAEFIGITEPGLWKIETRGKTLMRTLRKIARLLRVEPQDLLAEVQDEAGVTPRREASTR